MDVAEFAKARLDEDEAVAKAATPGPWLALDGGVQSADNESQWPVGETDSERDRADRVHIARHDPARALREVAAKRKRLTLMIEATAEMDKLLADEHAGDVARAMAIGRARAATVGVKIDAEIWHDHPDYDQKWTP